MPGSRNSRGRRAGLHRGRRRSNESRLENDDEGTLTESSDWARWSRVQGALAAPTRQARSSQGFQQGIVTPCGTAPYGSRLVERGGRSAGAAVKHVDARLYSDE